LRQRITFSKGGPLTYTSHLDLARIWERCLRRAGVALAYSGGFNPRPKLQLAAALPLGHTGEAELLDVWLEQALPVEELARAVVPVLPAGLSISQVSQVEPQEPPLQTRVVAAEYHVTVELPPEFLAGSEKVTPQVEARIARALAASEIPQERRGRRYDLRPLLERLWLERTGQGEVLLGMQLAAREGATARPEAVLEALGMSRAFARYHREKLILTPQGD
jgi:radical SAM-linked protein